LESGIFPAVGDTLVLGSDWARSISVFESGHCVVVGGENVKLSPKEWSIFKYIYDRKGKVVSREELAALIGADGGANTVDVHVCHLRDKIESRAGAKIFYTVRGVGYKIK
jgi:DNA-binding response OmpR family regulator